MTEECTSYKYTILPITAAEKEQALDFLKRTFFVDEPINQGVGLCQAGERCEALERYCLEGMLSGYSLRAVDDEGNIVAVIISAPTEIKRDSHKELAAAARECTDTKFRKVLHVLSAREAAARVWERRPAGTCLLEVHVAATDPGWLRRGIMKALVAHTERLARANNIHLLRMDTSSAYSAMAADRLGFTCVSTLLYKDITLDGQPATTPPSPHTEDKVYLKQL